MLVSSVLSQIINSWPNKKLLNYGYLEQLKDIFPGIALAVVMGFCVNMVGLFHLSKIINSWPNKKLLNYGYLEQLKDIFPGIALAVVMGFCVNMVGLFHLSNVVTLLIQISLGAVIYVSASSVLHLESYEYLIGMIRSVLK